MPLWLSGIYCFSESALIHSVLISIAIFSSLNVNTFQLAYEIALVIV